MPRTTVWVDLYFEGKEEPVADEPAFVKVVDDALVHALKKAVFNEYAGHLEHCVAVDLKVYAAKASTVSISFPVGTKRLEAGKKVAECPLTSYESPYIVVAPPKVPPTQQNTAHLPETTVANLELFWKDFNAKKATIVLSAATTSAYRELMDVLNVTGSGASWSNKPPNLKHIEGFSWLPGPEDSDPNREAYMAYLGKLLQIPGYDLVDAYLDKSLLTVDMRDIRKLSGTTDVAITKAQHAKNESLKNQIEALLELKKPENMRQKDHTPQAAGEHFAASYLNRKHAVVSVLTDLHQNWTFFWFAREEEDSAQVSLFKLRLTGNEATAYGKYLLDSLFKESAGDDTLLLPTTFAERLSFQDIMAIAVRKHKRERREYDGADSDSKPSPSRGAGQRPTSGTDASTSSRGGGGTANENNQGAVGGGGGGAPMKMASALSLFAHPTDRDVANELDLLDMVDESEQYEIVRSFATKHIVPFMTG